VTITITVSEEVVRRLNELSIAQTEDVETKLQRLLVAEYQRRMARYRLTDRRLSQKYGMTLLKKGCLPARSTLLRREFLQ